MPNWTHPFVSAVADDADSSTVSPTNWNDTHAVALVAGESDQRFERYTLSGTARLTIASSGRMRLISRPNNSGFFGAWGVGQLTILNDTYLLQYKEARLFDNTRVTIGGTGEWFLFDLAPVGRLVLAGRGG